MAQDNSISRILDDMERAYEGGEEKTASENSNTEGGGTEKTTSNQGVDQARQAASNSLSELFSGSGSGQQKQASQQASESQDDAVATLEKMAGDMADADYQATMKEAHVFGSAVFDGFISRAQQYAGAEKTASNNQSQQAEYNSRLKQASVAGYQDTDHILHGLAQQEKTAAEESVRGTVDALEKVAAMSEDCFVRGAQHMQKIANQLG